MNESMCFDCGENVKPTKDKKIFLNRKNEKIPINWYSYKCKCGKVWSTPEIDEINFNIYQENKLDW